MVRSLEQSLVNLPKKPDSPNLDPSHPGLPNLSLSQAQDLICQFFLEQIKQDSPELVLQEFKHLFVEPTGAVNSIPCQALNLIISSGSEEIFLTTLKRSIYILVNNWNTERQAKYIRELVHLLSMSLEPKRICTVILKRSILWRRNFVNSRDYQDLTLFASKYENRNQEHWSKRYKSYLLVSQSVDVRKPLEQQEAARTYSQQLKEKFKIELAMYTARYSSASGPVNNLPNPTSLGDEVLRLIQTLLNKQNRFSYASLARIFLSQTQQLRYKNFKQSFLNYLLFSIGNQDLVEAIKTQLDSQFKTLYPSYDNQIWDNSLLLRTCNRVIEYLTTVDGENPSLLFILLATQGKALTLAILLLKIILICPQTHTHLECRLAQLIQRYQCQSESECQWLTHFLEIIQLILTIYTENVRYDLVNMSDCKPEMNANEPQNFYRIFSQIKCEVKKFQAQFNNLSGLMQGEKLTRDNATVVGV
ncbi:MAG TPA: hypothetical protein V6D26_23160 [Stenomitos sp.]